MRGAIEARRRLNPADSWFETPRKQRGSSP